ncbi:mono/diheme cytochrome c family protein [Actimicrobium sp. GrIS 1.19]|uniref:c-type cytochrome n=1 Tax=Actimicrobium sp. GrIS 1.19 TaxID=3071708 RepID=UPI002DF7671D|nr:mono/diheme cytochrome c family protein [Actimicrobium sp. GrIS 1.19]
MTQLIKRLLLVAVAVVILVLGGAVAWQTWHEPDADAPGAVHPDPQQQVKQGALLARAGDCVACHTQRGGQPYAGGRSIATPFGALVSPNITADPVTGIGSWKANDFWRALHNGKSRDGHLLYPAFPYTDYTRITRADSDAMFAFFQTVTPVVQANQPHTLRFPYNQPVLLALWRTLYFRPGVYQPEPAKSAAWNRGAYLVTGLGHCSGCHAGRNVLGATDNDNGLSGGLIPVSGWYAPALTPGASGWTQHDLAAFLKTGVSARGAAFGPMAEVVQQSLQYVPDDDIAAMAAYLAAAPAPVASTEQHPEPDAAARDVLQQGAKLYDDHCTSCHKADGRGVTPFYPPLAGARTVTGAPVNPVRMVLNGGYAPSTTGNPQPHGMPPFGQLLDDNATAAVVSYIRHAWGNNAAPVSAFVVNRYRAVPLE